MNFFKNLFIYFYNKPKIIDKIAFLITEQYLVQHYKNILNHLKIDSFEIIFVNKFKQTRYKELINNLRSKGCSVVFLEDVLYRYKYKILLTHMYLGGNTIIEDTKIIKLKLLIGKLLKKFGINFLKTINQQYFQKKLGIYNIKFMYGLDVALKLKNYNEVFDEFFCHGRRDSKIYKKIFNKKTFAMGYPRYDDYFAITNNTDMKNHLLKKYSCSNKKPTILWICTTSRSFSTILTYEKYIEKLTDKYNVILRPHPMEIDPKRKRFRQKVLDIVNSKKFLISKNPSQKMTELYLIADYVFCDYGGSIFSALYCNKNILLMNHQNMAMDRRIYQSTAIEIRDYLPSINEKDCNDHFIKKIDNILSSPQNLIQLRKARKVYFGAKKNENCSPKVAYRLKQLLN